MTVVRPKPVLIPNHFTPALSELDLQMVKAVPPGGNWKDIPESVPSRRLDQIRASYRAGEGSRSTYYGRLRSDAPAYTISTYIGRPGNGCFIHYDAAGDQHRMISQREAARLQSFPDQFEFFGSRTAINTQIGNAVPPLLAFQVAQSLSAGPGEFVDLFAGAGGLSLGFTWAGWRPLVATDWDAPAMKTYAQNIHPAIVPGDIRDQSVMHGVVSAAVGGHVEGQPLWVLGGPPCQGFSTAGRPRTLADDRNRLFERYRDALVALQPDGFVFENVPGLLNMHRGAVVAVIRRELEAAGFATDLWVLHADEYGVPQRRMRILIVGHRTGSAPPAPPPRITTFEPARRALGIPAVYSSSEALSDLPGLAPGEDASGRDYASGPRNRYQQFARGELGAPELVSHLKRGDR